ncbi:MAG: FHA domain-containing serine/threonine-protein kinase [Acidobacteriota bacterium]
MMVGKVIGRYKVERELSEGGMAHVFVGTTIEESGGFPQGFPVVLKVMSEELAKESTARKRFIKEAQILSRLRHNRITRFYEFLPSETGPILVMEFVEGEPVDRLIARLKVVPVDQAIEITCDLLEALVYAHSKGIVHRDIKPANLICGLDNEVKVTDFGIAKIKEAGAGGAGHTVLTKSGLLLGTPHYMSPEQIREPKDAGAKSDIYSTGVLLYEMLTGSLPFSSGSLRKLIEAIYRGEKKPPSSIRPEIDSTLDGLVMKALEFDENKRYGSAQEFLDALQQYLSTQRPTVVVPDIYSKPVPLADMHWKLIANGSGALASHDVEGTDLTVGRDRSCEIIISHPAVSRKHAKITVNGALFLLEDLKSANGTFVNDQRIDKAALKAGDIVRFGADPVCSFVLQDH